MGVSDASFGHGGDRPISTSSLPINSGRGASEAVSPWGGVLAAAAGAAAAAKAASGLQWVVVGAAYGRGGRGPPPEEEDAARPAWFFRW